MSNTQPELVIIFSGFSFCFALWFLRSVDGSHECFIFGNFFFFCFYIFVVIKYFSFGLCFTKIFSLWLAFLLFSVSKFEIRISFCWMPKYSLPCAAAVINVGHDEVVWFLLPLFNWFDHVYCLIHKNLLSPIFNYEAGWIFNGMWIGIFFRENCGVSISKNCNI